MVTRSPAKTERICGTSWRARPRSCWGDEPLHLCVRSSAHDGVHQCSCLAISSVVRLEGIEPPAP